MVTLRLTARLVRKEGVEIIAGRTFAATAATPSTEAPALVEGFDRAAPELVDGVTAWTLDALDVVVGVGS